VQKKHTIKAFVAMLVVTLQIAEGIRVVYKLIDDLELMDHPQAINNIFSLFSLMHGYMTIGHVDPNLCLKSTLYIVEEFIR
jgi:LytS/YehU family sensor histidine kinase